MYTKKGFTLIELVIVIAILGILAGIAVPHFMETSASARGAKVLADLRTIDSACTIYTINNGTEPADIETLVKADLLASEPLANVETFIITKTNGTATPYNPNEFERKIYTIANGRGTYGSDNQTVEWYLNGDGSVVDNGTMADNMNAILEAINKVISGSNAIDSTSNGARTDAVIDDLKKQGIDLEALGATSWRYITDGGGRLFFTPVDISGLSPGSNVPMIQYNPGSKNWTVWTGKVSSHRDNDVNHGVPYNIFKPEAGYVSSTGSADNGNQTYEKALEYYNELASQLGY